MADKPGPGGDASRIDRRIVITSAAAAAAYLWAPARLAAHGPGVANLVVPPVRSPIPKLAFFSSSEFLLLDEFAEMLIPADAHSGGARAAGVAWTLDQRLAESLDPEWRQSWHDDLAEIDRLSRLRFGKGFTEATFEQRTHLMQRISRNEKKPSQPGEYAFGTIKWSVADIYYRTRIGIHDELQYQGNVLQDEFAGTDVSKKG